jgi:RyR domain
MGEEGGLPSHPVVAAGRDSPCLRGLLVSFTDVEIAQVVHAATMEMQKITSDLFPSPIWWYTDQDTQDLTIASVRMIRDGSTEEDIHKAWVVRKTELGWVYGTAKDQKKKTHPCIVEWDSLPGYQQAKTRVFAGIVRALS